MQTKINGLTLANIFELSQFIKEKCKDKTSFEEVAQELMKTLCQTFITDSGNNAIVLSRFFKSCSYGDLPDDIQDYVKQKESRNVIPPQDKYLTLLGTWGDSEEWRCREKSNNYKAFSLNDENVLYKFPMLSAVFSQIGFKMPSTIVPDKEIIVDKQDFEYGFFYVKDAKDNKLIPKQAEFVKPFGVKSTFGFGGHYVNTNIYAIIVFFRENISSRIAKLFLSLNPAIKLLTLRHEMTGKIFNIEASGNRSINKPLGVSKNTLDESALQRIEFDIRNEEAMAMADEVKKANEAVIETVEELQETTVSKNYVDNIINNMMNSLIVLSPEGKIRTVNQATLDLLGYTNDELLSQPVEIILENESSFKELIINDLSRKGSNRIGEKTLLSKEGRKIPVLFSASVMDGDNEDIRDIVCVALDITERKRMEKELETRTRQQEVVAYLRHKALLGDDLTDLMSEVVGKIAETLNNEYCKVLELLPDCDEMLLRAGVGWKEGLVGNATVHTGLDSQAGYTLNSKKPVVVEDLNTETRFSDSQFLLEHNVVSGMSVSVQSPDGPWGVLGTHTTRHVEYTKDDINFLHSVANLLANAIARKNTEDALKESESKYRKLVKTAQDAIVCDENGIITLWNKSAERMFGYSRSEVIGEPVAIIIPERYIEKHQKRMKQFMESGNTNTMDKTIELSGKTKGGIEFPIEMSLSCQKINDKKYIATAIIRDITFQKKAKEQLIEKAMEVENAHKELKEFVYTVSHDLKEPLFSIDGYSTRLHETYKDIYDEKSKRYSDRIKVNIKLMSDRIYEILEVAKIGLIAYNIKDNASEDIVKDVIKTLEGKIESNNINVLIKHNLPNVSCDERRMRDVFFNLVTNSIKFMGDDKQRQITIGCDKDGDYFKFFVDDTGIGIRKEYQNSVFRIFSRLKDVEVEGTGVGLVIVKKIIEIHRGKVWIESPIARGKGSRFCFTIPVSDK